MRWLSGKGAYNLGSCAGDAFGHVRDLAEGHVIEEADILPGAGIYSFIDAFDVFRKSVSEWAELGTRGLRRLYIGMETGDAGLLRFLRKPGTVADVVEAVITLKEAGLAASVSSTERSTSANIAFMTNWVWPRMRALGSRASTSASRSACSFCSAFLAFCADLPRTFCSEIEGVVRRISTSLAPSVNSADRCSAAASSRVESGTRSATSA